MYGKGFGMLLVNPMRINLGKLLDCFLSQCDYFVKTSDKVLGYFGSWLTWSVKLQMTLSYACDAALNASYTVGLVKQNQVIKTRQLTAHTDRRWSNRQRRGLSK